MKRYILTFLLLFLPLQVEAATVYFAQSGDDSGAGTWGDPYKTIQKAEALSPGSGDKQLFKCGDTWTLQSDPGGIFSINDAGITVGAWYGSGTEGISGNRPIFAGTVVNWGQTDGYPTVGTTPLVDITAANVTFENIEVKNNPMSYGVRADSTTAATIKGCVIHDCYKEAILCWVTPNSTIESNTLYDCARKWLIEGGAGWPCGGVACNNSSGCTITKNNITGTWGEGIIFANSSTVEYNTVGPTHSVGIYASGADDCVVRYNLVWGKVAPSNAEYESAGIANWNGHGMSLGPEFGSSNQTNNKFYGNIIINRSSGVRMKCAYGLTVQTQYIYNNTLIDNLYNFKVDNADRISNCYFKNNLCYFETGGDISVHASLSGDTTGVECDYNVWSGGQPSDAMFQGANDQTGAPNLTRTTWRELPITALGDFTTIDAYITAGSSAIDNGVDLGVGYNLIFGDATDFHTTPTNPTIELLPNSDYGAGPDIGAFTTQAAGEDPPGGENDFSQKAICCYKLDANVEDSSSGGANDLAAVASPTYSGGAIVLNGTTQYAHIAGLDTDITDSFWIWMDYEVDVEKANGTDCVIGSELDNTANERVWQISQYGAANGDDILYLAIGTANGTASVSHQGTYDLDHATRHRVLIVFNAATDTSYQYVYNSSGTTLSSENQNPVVGAATQNVENTAFGLGCRFNNGTAENFLDGKIYEFAFGAGTMTEADGAEMAQNIYGEPPISPQSMSGGNITAPGTHRLTIPYDRELFVENGTPYFAITYDWPGAVTYYYAGKSGTDTYWDATILAGYRESSFVDGIIDDDITVPSGCTMTDAQNNAAVITGALSGLASYPAGTATVPKPASAPWTIGSGKDFANKAAATYAVLNDWWEIYTLTENQTWSDSGTSGNPISIRFRGPLTGTFEVSGDYNNVYNSGREVSSTRTDSGANNNWYSEVSASALGLSMGMRTGGRRNVPDTP